jgi:phosphoserine phosphatase
MQKVEPVLIFDLDGTILRRNSFPIWAVTMLGWRAHGLTLRRRMTLSLAAQRVLLARKLRRLDHDSLMRRLQSLWQLAAAEPGATIAEHLQTRLLRLVRANIAPILRLVADDVMDGVLATAAAGEYAIPLGRQLGFSIISATGMDRSADEPHNSGGHKRDRVMELLRERGWSERPRIFFNDDLADLPLMRESQAVCWFGNDRDLGKAKAAAPGVRFVPCRAMRPNELNATIAHLGHSLAAAQLASMPWVFPAPRPRARTAL